MHHIYLCVAFNDEKYPRLPLKVHLNSKCVTLDSASLLDKSSITHHNCLCVAFVDEKAAENQFRAVKWHQYNERKTKSMSYPSPPTLYITSWRSLQPKTVFDKTMVHRTRTNTPYNTMRYTT